MRSIILSLSFTLFAMAGAPAAAAPWSGAIAVDSRCAKDLTHFARPGKGAQHRKLTDLPPADGYFAVFRRDADGCIVPVKVDFRHPQPSGRPAEPSRRR